MVVDKLDVRAFPVGGGQWFHVLRVGIQRTLRREHVLENGDDISQQRQADFHLCGDTALFSSEMQKKQGRTLNQKRTLKNGPSSTGGT